MFKEGIVLYFTPFYFADGSRSKNKYFVVLRNVDKEILLASLPSSKDYLPREVNPGIIGCVELPENAFNCFVLPACKKITECDKGFSKNTYLYGAYIQEYSVSKLKEIYREDGIDYEIWGRLKPGILEQIVECFSKSALVKRKIKKMLSEKG